VPTSTWERLPEARRHAVLAAAEAEFGARGFSGGSLNVIARSAGVAKGSLFQYFTDKVDLYAYLSELASIRVAAHMDEQVRTLPWSDGFFPAFRRLVVVWIDYFRTHPADLAVTAAVNLEPDPSARSAVRAVVNRYYLQALRPLVERARDAGELRADADLDAFIALLLLILPHLALAPASPSLDPLLGLGSGDRAAVEAGAMRLVDVLEAAFGVPVPASR
jgi:AcrR family transcriptional regulator